MFMWTFGSSYLLIFILEKDTKSIVLFLKSINHTLDIFQTSPIGKL